MNQKKKVGRPPKVDRNQKLVTLRDEEGRSFGEIAEELGIARSTACEVYHRTKRRRR